MRTEFFCDADAVYLSIAELQAALDVWVLGYNTERPHQSLGMRPPVERFALAAPCPDTQIVDPIAAVVEPSQAAAHRPDLRHAGVQRWVNQRGSIRLAGFGYRVPIVLAGEPVEAVVADNLVQIYHHDVLVASHVQRRKPDTAPAVLRQGRRIPRPASTGIVVTRMVDASGQVSFAGTMYRAGRAWRGTEVEVCIVAGSVQMTYQGTSVRTQPIRHDRAKEYGAYATPHGRPRKPRQDGATPVKQLPELIRQAGTGT